MHVCPPNEYLQLDTKHSSLTMHTTGSRSFSPGTSIHVIAMALGSPGEHGVSRSSTTTSGLFHDDPRTLISVWMDRSKDSKKQSDTLNRLVTPSLGVTDSSSSTKQHYDMYNYLYLKEKFTAVNMMIYQN